MLIFTVGQQEGKRISVPGPAFFAGRLRSTLISPRPQASGLDSLPLLGGAGTQSEEAPCSVTCSSSAHTLPGVEAGVAEQPCFSSLCPPGHSLGPSSLTTLLLQPVTTLSLHSLGSQVPDPKFISLPCLEPFRAPHYP